ncbi:alpha-galactosidase [Actinospica sp. MGRD01-02]|uniref:alpha-galactosidase n=1 Tax=Actinospica acidithermotolerans TaxID=2828514 RepID=A0A941IKM5_9ACTN|nr:alpha-galactosidase [Actinospica acidithermotolerans]MBR7828253.1 alpha-galactosidase [Actinospica acidithermotolerans]
MPAIAHSRDHRLWVLTAAESCYVLHLDDDDLLHGLHWGPALTPEQAVTLLDYPPPRPRSCEDPRDGTLDLSAAGGARYAHAGLQVRFADGTRDLELRFTGHRVAENDLVLTFADNHYPLAVETHYRVCAGSPAIERRLTARHTGDPSADPIRITRADSATWILPTLADYRLSQSYGQWAAENQVSRSTLARGATVLGSGRGVSSHHASPWAMIDDGSATGEHGAVYGTTLAWSGNWQIIADRLPSERLSLSVGAAHVPETRLLEPGDELSTPVSVGMYTEGGFGAASRAWHDYIRANVIPHPDEARPVLYNSWEATEFDVSVKAQMALADRAAALGVELFVMDDGWFGRRVDDTAGLGDWTPNPDRFPDGLGPLIEHVHGLGMKFGLWVEPEMANPDSDLYRARPDWIISRPQRHRTRIREQHVLNLARSDVAEWVHATIERLLSENAIDFLKWDMNRPLTEVGDDTSVIDYVTNLYAILDRLRADHPALRIENCSSGGGRVDLAACPDAELARLGELIAAYKSVRHVVQLGVQHRLGPSHAVQFLARDGSELVVLAFHNSSRFGRPAAALPLRALDPQAVYRDTATGGGVHHGAVLMTRGLPLDLPAGECASTLIHLRRVGLSPHRME